MADAEEVSQTICIDFESFPAFPDTNPNDSGLEIIMTFIFVTL